MVFALELNPLRLLPRGSVYNLGAWSGTGLNWFTQSVCNTGFMPRLLLVPTDLRIFSREQARRNRHTRRPGQ